jgi:hypothetical protein
MWERVKDTGWCLVWMKCVRVSLVLTEPSIGHKRVVQTRTLDESIDESLHVRRIAHESTHTHTHRDAIVLILKKF